MAWARCEPAREPARRDRSASDAAVMLRVAAGDEAGFNYLVRKYHRPMIHFLYRMVHNQAVAEELGAGGFSARVPGAGQLPGRGAVYHLALPHRD